MKSSQAWIYAGVAAMIVVVLSAMCAIGYFAFFRPSQSTPDTSAAYTEAAQTIVAQVTQDAVSTLIAQFTQSAVVTSTPPTHPNLSDVYLIDTCNPHQPAGSRHAHLAAGPTTDRHGDYHTV